MTASGPRAARAVCALLLLAMLPGCVYYNTLYLAKRYYVRSFDDTPYALDKEDLSPTPQFPRAIELSKKVIAQYPKSKYVDDAYLLWAKSLIGSDDPRQAITMLEDFDTAHPKSAAAAEAQFYLGVAYLRARKYEASLRTFDAYLAKHPKHGMAPYAYYERSRALLGLDRPGEAAQSVGQLLDKYPKSRLALRARIARAEAFVAQKSFDAARQDYRFLGKRALTDDERLNFLLEESDCLEGAMKFDEAMTLLKDAIAHEREPARSDTSGGRVAVAPSGPGADHYGRLLTRIGSVELRSNHLDNAVAAYRRVIEDYPRTPIAAEAQYRLGYAYETLGDDFDKARAEYARVRDQGAGTTFTDQAATRVASIDRLAQYRKAGGDTLQRAAEGDFLLAEQYLFQLDKPDRALEQYRKIEQTYSGSPWAAKALNAQGWVLARKMQRQGAADSLFWKVVHEYPGTEAQLAARDYLEHAGVAVPVELIKLPEPVYTHADSVAALAALAAAAAAAADTMAGLTPIPQDSMRLGEHAATPGVGDSLRLGPRGALNTVAPGDSNALGREGGSTPGTGRFVVHDSTDSGSPAPRDSVAAPHPVAPGLHPAPAPAPPDTALTKPPGTAAPPDTTHHPAPPRDTTQGARPVAPPGGREARAYRAAARAQAPRTGSRA